MRASSLCIPCIQLAIKHLFFFVENMLISPRESDAQLMSTLIICNEMFSITFLIQSGSFSNNWVVVTQDSTSCSVSVVPAAMASSSALLPFPCKEWEKGVKTAPAEQDPTWRCDSGKRVYSLSLWQRG
ncbi:hypothetical protein D3C80_1804950 [compost metagenome]